MARFRVNTKAARESIKRKINRIIRDKGILDKVGQMIVEPMKEGVNPVTGKPYKPLASSTIANRRAMAKYNQTSPRFSPDKSNLTFSGQLLDSIKHRIVISKSIIIIEPTGTRRAYRKKSGKPAKRSVKTNKELAKIHSKGGKKSKKGGRLPKREVLKISKKKLKEVNQFIKRELLALFNN